MPPSNYTETTASDPVLFATYRLQFNRDFTLSDARKLIPYLHDLGVSHIYASPLLRASPGSTHGYDTCDFEQLNPELGTQHDFAKLDDELTQHQMGLILDVVPNHMGIGPDNQWWRDVLTHGQASRYAGCFDIDWHAADPRLHGKVALPILAERYHDALRHGKISLAETAGDFSLNCAGQNLPLSPETLSNLQAQINGKHETVRCLIEKTNADPKSLDESINMQNYLLMFWRSGDATLNYRRFFTISSLAGIRIEEGWVFDKVFSLVKQWLDLGWVDGLRVDHIDGLRQPKEFLRRLRKMAPKAPIVVEKILEPGESLDPSWPVEGTTGYDFLNNVCGLFIDPQGEKPLSDFYTEFTGDATDYVALVRAKKQLIINQHLAAESHRLTDLLVHISARHWECRDFTRTELGEAWVELATCLPVYRTYVGAEVSKPDARLIHGAAAASLAQRPDLSAELFDFLEELLLMRRRGVLEDDFVLRFQQLTGPIMAKAIEDTAFYCYGRFVALNEVGGDPSRFGLGPTAFHQWCHQRQLLWPRSLNTTSTHDTKRGADVRTRLAALSEMPQEWTAAVWRWSKMNEAKRRGGRPDRKAEYFLYQTLVGAWPLSLDRALAYMRKAAREAKEHTDWCQPVQKYEEALEGFITDGFNDSAFMTEVERFVSRLLDVGWVNSLAQTLVKLTAPGVPDIYQGTELWDLTLTDPDNRRPVDFDQRRQFLTTAKALSAEEAWRQRAAGMPNLWLTWKTLNVRRTHADFFGPSGHYDPLPVTGSKAAHVLAFMRGCGAVTIVPRLTLGVGDDWRDTLVELPAGRWKNALTSNAVASGRMTELLAHFPVALLLKADS